MVEYEPATTLDQILERIGEAKAVREAKSRADLDRDLTFRLAAERVVEVIGEAVNRLPAEFRGRYPAIPWHRIIGMRNWLAHGYDAVDAEVLWDVLTCRVDELEPEFIRIRSEITGQPPP